jgi:hypothetical protein
MSQQSQTETTVATGTGLTDWQAGVVGGLVGGVVMGAIIWMMNPAVIVGAIAGLYTLQGSAIAGWIAHLAHSAILGAIFAGIVRIDALSGYANRVGPSAVMGIVWGFILWVIAAGLIMPLWLTAVGFPMAPPFPNWALPGSLIPHLVYGVILGVLYSFLRR